AGTGAQGLGSRRDGVAAIGTILRNRESLAGNRHRAGALAGIRIGTDCKAHRPIAYAATVGRDGDKSGVTDRGPGTASGSCYIHNAIAAAYSEVLRSRAEREYKDDERERL